MNNKKVGVFLLFLCMKNIHILNKKLINPLFIINKNVV